MRTHFDQLAKHLLVVSLGHAGQVEAAREIASQVQSVDIFFRPQPGQAHELARLGLLGRMAQAPSCMIEPFSRTPGIAEVRACIRKQHALHHADLRGTRQEQVLRTSDPVAPDHAVPDQAWEAFPVLWIVSAGRPDTVIRAYGLVPMLDWPTGCWQRQPIDGLHVISVRDLPRTRETLLIRLLGRGPTLRHAVRDVRDLPDTAWERRFAEPVLVAFRLKIPQDLKEEEMPQIVEDLQAVYTQWEARVRNESLQRGLQRGLQEGRQEGLQKGLQKGLQEGRQEGLQKGRQEGLQKGLQKGLQEGRQEGRQEGERALLRRLLERRFGALADAHASRIAHASLDDVERWAERVFDARSLDDVFRA